MIDLLPLSMGMTLTLGVIVSFWAERQIFNSIVSEMCVQVVHMGYLVPYCPQFIRTDWKVRVSKKYHINTNSFRRIHMTRFFRQSAESTVVECGSSENLMNEAVTRQRLVSQ